MILSILATVAVLAAIVVLLAALVLAETVLVYIALGLGATSVILLIGALVQQRSGTTGPEPELSGTDGLGKSSVPVTQTGPLMRGATVVGSMPDTAEPEDSRRVPAPASEPVRDASAPGTDTVEAEEETEYGEPEYEVPRWQTPTQGDRPDPGRVHAPTHEGTPEEETTPAPAAPAGASAFDDEEVPFSSSVRAAEAGWENNGDVLRHRGPADTGPVPELDEDQSSAPEQVEPEEAPAAAPTPDDDGEPVNDDGTDGPRAEALEDEESVEEPAEAPEPAADLVEEGPELSAISDEGFEDEDVSAQDEIPAESVRSFDEEAGAATDEETDTEAPGAEAELEVPVEEGAAEDPAPADETASADVDEGALEARSESVGTDIDGGTEDGTDEAEPWGPAEEGATEAPVPADDTDSADTVEGTDGDLESEEERDVPGVVSTDTEVSSGHESADGGVPASATEAEGSEAEESGDPGREPEDGPSAEEAAEDGTDEAEPGVPAEEGATEAPVPADDSDSADTVGESDGDLEPEEEQDVAGVVSTDTEVSSGHESADGGVPASATEAEELEAEESGDPGREPEDGPSAEEAAEDGTDDAENGVSVEEGAAEDPAPVDEIDSADTVGEPDGDLEPEEEQDVAGVVSTDTEVSSGHESADGGVPASATEAEGSEAEESGDPGREPEDEPSAEEAAEDGTDDAENGDPEDNAGEHAVAYAIIVDSDRDPADQETDTVGAEDSGSSH